MPTLRHARRALGAAALLLAACGPDRATGPGAEVPRRALTAAEAGAVRASNAFALDLLREVGAEAAHRGRNLVLSPYSGMAALSMTANGAAGATRAGMQQALGVAGQTAEQNNATFRDLTAYLLGADRRVTVRTANSVWAAEGFPVRPEFAQTVRTFYDAEARTARFGTAEATRAINAWASEKTEGRIAKLFDDGQPDASYVVLLMNALYFKGEWAARFDAARTRPAPFRLADGGTVNVPTMSRDETAIRTALVEGAQVGELAYGGGAYAMTLVLPPPGTGVEAYAAGLTPARWDALVGALRTRRSRCSCPGSRSRAGRGGRAARAAGHGGRVRPAPRRLLGAVAGVSAAGAVGEGLPHRLRAAGRRPAGRRGGHRGGGRHVGGHPGTSAPVPFTVDRPFLFAIRERASGAILFVGRVVDPRG
jgi:serpin B